LDNVRAIAAANLTKSSARSLFARADVVLAWYTKDEDTHLVPLINEISLLNSASKLIDFWGPQREHPSWPVEDRAQHAGSAGADARSAEQLVREGWGYALAEALAREIVTSFFLDLHAASAHDGMHIKSM
jgi:hypothetical protein